MTIKKETAFDSISQRAIYGLNLIYSDFAPVEAEAVSEQAQRKLHERMGLLIDRLYERPALLNLICTKAGKNKMFAINVTYDGKEYTLCPSFPRHSWDTIDRGRMDVLFKYRDAQEKYGVDWKKRMI